VWGETKPGITRSLIAAITAPSSEVSTQKLTCRQFIGSLLLSSRQIVPISVDNNPHARSRPTVATRYVTGRESTHADRRVVEWSPDREFHGIPSRWQKKL